MLTTKRLAFGLVGVAFWGICAAEANSLPPPVAEPQVGRMWVTEDPKAFQKLKDLIDKVLKEAAAGVADINILKTQNFIKQSYLNVGVVAGFHSLSADEIEHSPEMMRADGTFHDWSQLTLGAHVGQPLPGYDDTDIVGDISDQTGVSFGISPDVQVTFAVTAESKQVLQPIGDLPQEVKDTFGRLIESFSEVKYMVDPSKLPPGSSIDRVARMNILLGVADVFGDLGLQFGASVQALINGQFETRVDMLSPGPSGAPHARVTVSLSSNDSLGVGFDGLVGVQFTAPGAILTGASLTFLNAGISGQFEKIFQMKYDFDLGRAAAVDAYKKILVGDLRAAQAIATRVDVPTGDPSYQGVVIEDQSTSQLWAQMGSFFFGLGVAKLDFDIFNIKFNMKEDLSRFGSVTWDHGTSHAGSGDSDGGLEQATQVYAVNRDFKFDLPGGILQDETRSLSASGVVYSVDTLGSDEKPDSLQLQGLESSYLLIMHQKHFAAQNASRLWSLAQNLTAIMASLAKPADTDLRLPEKVSACQPGGMDLSMEGSLGEAAFAAGGAVDEATIWTVLGRLLGLSDPAALVDPASRAAVAQASSSDIQNEIARLEAKFLPAWRQFQAESDINKRAKDLEKIYNDYDWDPMANVLMFALGATAKPVSVGYSVPSWMHLTLVGVGCMVDQGWQIEQTKRL